MGRVHRHTIRAEEFRNVASAAGQSQCLPEELGSGETRIFQLDPGLSYLETECTPIGELSVASRIDEDEPRLVLTVGIQGRSRFVDARGAEVEFREGYATITAFSSSRGERHYRAGQKTLQLRLAAQGSWLERYFGEVMSERLLNPGGLRVLSHKPLSVQGMLAAQQVMACNPVQPTARLTRHGHAMTVLAAELAHLFEDDSGASARAASRERAMAESARAILLQELHDPPSLQDLARRIGTNQLKLKRLFHRHFNNTPYGLLLEIRMRHAYRLLESGHSVGAAAAAVGYQHASNFSTAFARYFGIPPRQVGRFPKP